MIDKYKTGMAIGFILLFESQIFPFMLSSAFTARTIVKEKNEQSSVQTDIWIAVGLSIVFSVMIGFFFEDLIATVVGSAFGFVMALIYEYRGDLLDSFGLTNIFTFG